MKRKIVLTLTILLIISSFSTMFSFADVDKGMEELFNIFARMSQDNRELGAKLLDLYLKEGNSGIEDLKMDLDKYLDEGNIETLKSMGYSLDDIRSELNRLKTWSKDEKDDLVKYIYSGDSVQLKKLIANAGSSVPPVSDNEDNDSKGQVKVDDSSPKDQPKKELIDVLFKDIKGHKNEDDIIYLAEREIINGKSPERFDPDGALTRAEFVTLISKLLEIKPSKDKTLPFKDVDINSWYYEYVKASYDNEVIKGTSSVAFSPNSKVSREAMVVIIMRILNDRKITFTLEKLDKDILLYEDAGEISDWATLDMFYGVRYGIIDGRTDRTLNPRDFATRGEAAEIIKKLFVIIEESTKQKGGR